MRVRVVGCSGQRTRPLKDSTAAEIATVEGDLATTALARPGTADGAGVGLITASTFLAYTGDVTRFATTARLVGYLGHTRRSASPATGPLTWSFAVARGGR
jgi:transposase